MALETQIEMIQAKIKKRNLKIVVEVSATPQYGKVLNFVFIIPKSFKSSIYIVNMILGVLRQH